MAPPTSTLDPALMRVVEALADLMVDRDIIRMRTGLSDANDPLRPLFKRPAERALHS